MCTCEICVLLAALPEPLCMYLVNLSIKDASRHAEPVQARLRSESSPRRAAGARRSRLPSSGAAALSARGAAARPSPRTPGLTGTAHG